MNAQQQDALRILASRGPMTSRALFDIMQDELGYWSQASSNDQQQVAVESLSKILSKMKSESLIYGSMTAQPKGRPVMVWSATKAEKSDGEIYSESSARHVPQELHDMAKSMFENGFAGPPDDDDSTIKESLTVHDDHIFQPAEMASDVAEISQEQSAEYVVNHDIGRREESDLHIYVDTIKINSGETEEMCLSKTCGEYVYLNGDLMIRNQVELEVFSKTIGDLLRA